MANRRKPTALRIIEGNPGHRALPAREPQAPIGAKMPDGLTARAQAHWPKLAKQLTAARILTELDAPALAMHCELFASWRDACDKLTEFGPVVETDKGGLKLSPYWVTFMQASSEMRRLLTEFGMTPASRSRVAAAKQRGDGDDDDPFDDF
jgi:P27 family predicted phage terminase small subunit